METTLTRRERARRRGRIRLRWLVVPTLTAIAVAGIAGCGDTATVTGDRGLAAAPNTSADASPTSEVADHADHALPGGNAVAIDESQIPPAQPSRNGVYINPAAREPTFDDGTGQFRINCSFSHMSFDDPIVYPGAPGASHLHVYYGNDSIDAFSDAEAIATGGGSTCTGGIVNRSGYWVPAIIDTATGAPVVPEGESALQAYYKTGYHGVPSDEVQNMPAGLRMVAGDATATTPGDLRALYYSCVGEHSVQQQASFPECAPGDLFVMSVEFPQCWDGVNLDSPDHKSHMAYANDGCPATHPVPIPVITQNFRFTTPPSGTGTWRLASDMYEGPAGYSGHADWWNGWDHDTFQRVVDHCFQPALDCSMNYLGDGYQLQ